MEPKVSVIIPVYNVEKYIGRCIESLQRQTLSDCEFIFIDDRGTDHSVDVVERYAEGDPRIRLLHNPENSGAGRSRNRGIDAATGEYIGFVDSDDWIADDFLELLYRKAKAGDYDIVKGRRVIANEAENGEFTYGGTASDERIKQGMSEAKPLYTVFTSEHQSAIFRRSLIRDNGIYNGSTSHSENSVFLLKAAYFSTSFSMDSRAVYYYYQRDDSMVHTFNRNMFEDEIISFKEQLDILHSLGEPDSGYYYFIVRKLRFLMTKYDELSAREELQDYSHEFVDGLCDVLNHVRDSKKLTGYGYKISLLVNNEKEKYIKISSKKGLVRVAYWGKKKLSAFNNRKRLLERKPPFRIRINLFGRSFDLYRIKNINYTGGDLCYMQNYRGAIVFSRKLVEKYKSFANDYINAFVYGRESCSQAFRTDSELYGECREGLKNGDLCWRFVKRFGVISKSTIYEDENGNLSIRGEFIGADGCLETKYFLVHPQETRNIIKGEVLTSHLLKLGFDEKVKETERYIDYLFEVFGTENARMRGLCYDAFPFNCILTPDGKYRLFDLEFEYKGDLDRGYMLYKVARVFKPEDKKEIYKALCEHYGMEYQWDYWDDFNFDMWMDTIALNDNLNDAVDYSKYFIKE